MKPLINLILLISISTAATGQLHTEIREQKEIGKEFHFENSKDGVLHSLDLTFTGFVGTELIKAKFVYKTEDFKNQKPDSLHFDIYCTWIADIVDVDSAGYEYNTKICQADRDNKEYLFEINESQTDYPSVNLTIFDRKEKENLFQMVLTRKEKE